MTSALRVGLLGCGTIGRALVRLLADEGPRLASRNGVDLRLVAVASRGLLRRPELLADLPAGARPGEDLLAVAEAPDVDAVVELVGGLEPAGTVVARALAAGKSVVTANKLLLAECGTALARLARASDVTLAFEAAVAGGVPILRALRESFVSDRVESVAGILNGTCNFVLTEMARSARPFAEVLADARRLGYAEADPSADVEGNDAACKLAILARLAFGAEVPPADVRTSGITRLSPVDFASARLLRRTPRQLGVARRLPDGRLRLSVRTHLVPAESTFGRVDGPTNAVRVTTAHGGEYVLAGPGAGGGPTAVSVLGDLVDLARRGGSGAVPPFGTETPLPFSQAGADDFVAPFHVRLVTSDRPGTLAAATAAFDRSGVRIDAVPELPREGDGASPCVLTLGPTTEGRLEEVLAGVAKLPSLLEPPLVLPMTP